MIYEELRLRCILNKSKVLIVLPVAVVLALWVTMVVAGAFPGGQSKPVLITVTTNEPIRVTLMGVVPPDILEEYAAYPGQSQVLTYEISNQAPVPYVVELVPIIEGEWQQVLLWELRQVEGKDLPSFVVNPQGPAHLLVGGEAKVKMELVVTWPRSIMINPLPSASVALNARRTDCVEVEDCLWGW